MRARGFSLVELLVAGTVLAIGLVAIMALYAVLARNEQNARAGRAAEAIADDLLEAWPTELESPVTREGVTFRGHVVTRPLSPTLLHVRAEVRWSGGAVALETLRGNHR